MADGPMKLLAFGDSLTAGYNLAPAQSFPVKLEAALRAQGYRVQVTNAGVSGETTADGRARLSWVLASGDPFDFAVVELGANDALRGLDPGAAFANLDAILTALTQRKVKSLLAGMLAPRNLGEDYVRAFDAIYPALQAKHGVPLYPFFLDGVAMQPRLLQSDGLHPNASGVDVIVQRILPDIDRLLGPPPPAGKELAP